MEVRSAEVKRTINGGVSEGRECTALNCGAALNTMCPQQQKQSSSSAAALYNAQLCVSASLLSMISRPKNYPSFDRTLSLRAFPSTRLPASLACAAFITAPICFADVAPVSAIAAATALSKSSSVADAGMKDS